MRDDFDGDLDDNGLVDIPTSVTRVVGDDPSALGIVVDPVVVKIHSGVVELEARVEKIHSGIVNLGAIESPLHDHYTIMTTFTCSRWVCHLYERMNIKQNDYVN